MNCSLNNRQFNENSHFDSETRIPIIMGLSKIKIYPALLSETMLQHPLLPEEKNEDCSMKIGGIL
jgi:hypothetical protein